MKPNIKAIRAIIVLLFSVQISVFSQGIEYLYDNAGNRVTRHPVIISKSLEQTDDSDTTFFNEEEQSFAEGFEPKELYTEQIEERKISIYPNPTGGQLIIQISSISGLKNSEVNIFEMNGKLLFNKKIFSEYSLIDISNVPSGIYIMKIYLDDKISEWKINKQ